MYIICLDLGEKIRETLTSFLEQERVEAGFLYGLGAVRQAEIAHYSLSARKYNTKIFDGEFEVTNITGNVALVDGKPFLHMHITLGDNNYQTFGGHLMEGIVAPTLELILTTSPVRITRTYDEISGLKLLNFRTK